MSLAGRQVAVRADASIRIGSGHVMRCLTLADALADAGATCRFVMRAHDGHLAELVRARGHAPVLLPPGDGRNDGATAHADWLGTDWETDAREVCEALAGRPVDLLVIDHYALDRRWQSAVRDRATHRMALDDLADRPHDVDLLVDQNFGACAADYAALLSPDTVRLIGPRYALLRPEFSAAREHCRTVPADRPLRHILIAMGGTDADNISERLLGRLDAAELTPGAAITVVLGNGAPHVDAVRARAVGMRYPTQLLVGVADMSRIFAAADLCIGATGGMSWERCCLGLPTLMVVLAANQARAAQALARAGAGLLAGDIRQAGWEERFDAQLRAAFDPRLRDTLRQRSLEICDGRGAGRIVEAVERLWER